MSLLNHDFFGVPMKRVFSLRCELLQNPQRLEKTQALTLNAAKPNMGLSGLHGLFGSSEWWESIEAGRIPLLRLSGIAERVYATGQDADSINTIDLRLQDGSERTIGIYLNDRNDLKLFLTGSAVSIIYAMDELKLQPAQDGGKNYSKVALEMAVSLTPL